MEIPQTTRPQQSYDPDGPAVTSDAYFVYDENTDQYIPKDHVQP